MSCLKCGNDSHDALRFRVLEVHTLHIRDFTGERIIQALGEFREYEICTACAEREARAFLYPAKMILRKCFAFIGLILAGMILSLLLALNDSWPAMKEIFALRALGPLAVIVGVIGIFGKAREILSLRGKVSRMNHDDAMNFAAYTLVLENAPKKYNDNDITYIPVSKDTLNMNAPELAEKYNLLPSISVKAREIMSNGGKIDE